MQTDATLKRDSLMLGLFGLAFSAVYSLASLDIGGVQLSSQEAWSKGVAQPFVLAGLLLSVFSTASYRGAAWARWAIVGWGPATITGGMRWALSRGVGAFSLAEFMTLGAPVLVVWVAGTSWMLFGRRSRPAVQDPPPTAGT